MKKAPHSIVPLLTLLLLISVFIQAQDQMDFSESFENEFSRFAQTNNTQIQHFREKTNHEFSEFLKHDWEKFISECPQERPLRPEPLEPTVSEPEKEKTKPQELRTRKTILPIETSTETNITMSGIQPVISPKKKENKIPVSFYGHSYDITSLFNRNFTLDGLTEESISHQWNKLTSTPYDQLLNECAGIRKALHLNDWGYFCLCREIARKLSGQEEGNETVFLQTFLLCQSGYDAKIARSDGKLLLLTTASVMVYGHSFLNIDDKKYFIWNIKMNAPSAIYTYRKNLSSASNALNLYINETPRLNGPTIKVSKRLNGEEIEISIDSSLIAFYREYPQCDFPVYMKTPVDKTTTRTLLPALQQRIEGKTETDAARLLLHFVQTSFDYRTDLQQFGYEKPLFIEETIFYPYCDCEDRALLFAYLIWELLNLEVVLLDYPDHVATAVSFTEDVTGDFIQTDNRKYIVCDPTYINAAVGEAMPRYKTETAQIIK